MSFANSLCDIHWRPPCKQMQVTMCLPRPTHNACQGQRTRLRVVPASSHCRRNGIRMLLLCATLLSTCYVSHKRSPGVPVWREAEEAELHPEHGPRTRPQPRGGCAHGSACVTGERPEPEATPLSTSPAAASLVAPVCGVSPGSVNLPAPMGSTRTANTKALLPRKYRVPETDTKPDLPTSSHGSLDVKLSLLKRGDCALQRAQGAFPWRGTRPLRGVWAGPRGQQRPPGHARLSVPSEGAGAITSL